MMERFWSHVNKDGPIVVGALGPCWMWTGSKSGKGYGNFSVAGKTQNAHRWLHQQLFGPIPKGILVCHKCDNRPCVQPEHLFRGTNQDNIRDCARKGRIYRGGARIPWTRTKTHCVRGHPLAGENVCHSGGRRNCRTCMRLRWHTNKERRNTVRRLNRLAARSEP